MDITYNICPFMGRRACRKLIIKVPVPQKSKHTTHKAHFK